MNSRVRRFLGFYQEEVSFCMDVLTGKSTLAAFNGSVDSPWLCFARYCNMQAATAKLDGYDELADILSACANRAARKVGKE